MFKNDEIRDLWGKTKPKIWDGNYWMVSFASEQKDTLMEIISEALITSHYHSMIRDHHEVSLILHETTWVKFSPLNFHQSEFGPLVGITFDVPLEIEVSGYLAPMVGEMANKSVSIVPQCALIYDHIFISVNDKHVATSIISDLHRQARAIP